ADGAATRARRLRRAVRVSPTKAKVGERLPYVLGKPKAPRVLERLEQTAALGARAGVALRALPRDALGGRGLRPRRLRRPHAHPPRRLPRPQDARGLRLDGATVGGETARLAPRPARLDRGAPTAASS